MRKFTILFISIILLNSCTSGQKKYSEESICPYIFVSGEHKDYYSYGKENVSEEMAYIATINNFKMKCKQSERKAIFSILDILFIITPLKTDVDNYEFLLDLPPKYRNVSGKLSQNLVDEAVQSAKKSFNE